MRVSPAAATLAALGDTTRFVVVAKDSKGNTTWGQTLFAWSSSDPQVATVDSVTGLATAVANGTASIIASTEGIQGAASLTVAQAVSRIEVTPDRSALTALGDTVHFAARANDLLGNPIPDTTFAWHSSDTAVVKVDGAGRATAVGYGSVTITATAEGVAGAASITITRTGMRPRFEPAHIVFPVYPGRTLSPAWGDFDNDGDLDLPLARNEGAAAFAEIPGFRALLNDGNYHGASWGDYDNDGFLDLVVLAYETGRSLLLHNEGDGTFQNVAPLLGMDIEGSGETAVWGDFDGDGDQDLFTPYYSHISPFQSFLYRNEGNGTFTDIADDARVSLRSLPERLRPEGAHAADINGDGSLDLYCAHHLFINQNDGTFKDVREAVGLPAVFDEGSEFVDYDNDGDLDLYLRTVAGGRLFRWDGAAFEDVTARSGIPATTLMWGDSWADVDHDGDVDLLYFSRTEPARLLINHGNGTFHEDRAFSRLGVMADNSAWGDYDNDGDLDVVVGANAWRLYRNELDSSAEFPNSYLQVVVLNAQGHRTQHGATVRLRRADVDDGQIQTRVVDGGSGYLSQNQYATHFGVVAGGVYAIEVVFPSGSGGPLVLDARSQPSLGGIVPEELADKNITVYRDGRVMISGR